MHNPVSRDRLIKILEFLAYQHSGLNQSTTTPVFTTTFLDPVKATLAACSERETKFIGDEIEKLVTFYKNKNGSSKDASTTYFRIARPVPLPALSIPPRLADYVDPSDVALRTDDTNGVVTVSLPQLPSNATSKEKKAYFDFKSKVLVHAVKRQLKKIVLPIYTNLFTNVLQSPTDNDLFVGLGCCTFANGVSHHLYEISCEVQMAPDGALLVSPCPHSSLKLNRDIIEAVENIEGGDVANDSSRADKAMGEIASKTAEIFPPDLFPAEPETFKKLLKWSALVLHPNGAFVGGGALRASARPSSQPATSSTSPSVTVDDSFSLLTRPRSTSAIGRECREFISQLSASPEKLDVPKGVYSITHGPNVDVEEMEREKKGRGMLSFFRNIIGTSPTSNRTSSWTQPTTTVSNETTSAPTALILPSSRDQDLISSLLSSPAVASVVASGPPGTGKSHSIANIICSLIQQNKRVLVVSKNPAALGVIRERVPKVFRDFIADLSGGEGEGMRGVMRTVETLVEKIGRGINEENRKRGGLPEGLKVIGGGRATGKRKRGEGGDETATDHGAEMMFEMEKIQQREDIVDEKIREFCEMEGDFFTSDEGANLAKNFRVLCMEDPHLKRAEAVGSRNDLVKDIKTFEHVLEEKRSLSGHEFSADYSQLFSSEEDTPELYVLSELYATVLEKVKLKSSKFLPKLQSIPSSFITAIPIIGRARKDTEKRIYAWLDKHVFIDGKRGGQRGEKEWKLCWRFLTLHKTIRVLERKYKGTFGTLMGDDNQPRLLNFLKAKLQVEDSSRGRSLRDIMKRVADIRKLEDELKMLRQRKAEVVLKLAEWKTLKNLSRGFDNESQAKLIRFSQMAGKMAGSAGSAGGGEGKESRRQKRHREEWLKGFDACVPLIPCWIMTQNKVSKFLSCTYSSFDLVILDEASQSDSSVLPVLLRGRKWLIVGDCKQVSPQETFISEEKLSKLRSLLPKNSVPECSFLLPGQSFFEFANQAFPSSRVVLKEHYRCDPKIIDFCNGRYYRGNLVPLRIGKREERCDPSVIDVYLADGKKEGKTNQQECKYIVRDIKNKVNSGKYKKKTIGVISLIGEEQAALIRNEILNAIGAAAYKTHEIVCGCAPKFQGSEKDVIYVSMVASRHSMVAQTQNMHRQRLNVCMSRARDLIVIVRSLKGTDIANGDDCKKDLINWLETESGRKRSGGEGQEHEREQQQEEGEQAHDEGGKLNFVLEDVCNFLKHKLYEVKTMGEVWEGGIFVENAAGDRVAIGLEFSVDTIGGKDLTTQREAFVNKQRVIERVGWDCYRISPLRWIARDGAEGELLTFLTSRGIKPAVKDRKDKAKGKSLREDDIQLDVEEDNYIEITSSSSGEGSEGEESESDGDEDGDDYEEEEEEEEDDDDDSDDEGEDDEDAINPSIYGEAISAGSLASPRRSEAREKKDGRAHVVIDSESDSGESDSDSGSGSDQGDDSESDSEDVDFPTTQGMTTDREKRSEEAKATTPRGSNKRRKKNIDPAYRQNAKDVRDDEMLEEDIDQQEKMNDNEEQQRQVE